MVSKKAVVMALSLIAGVLIVLGTSFFKNQSLFFWGTALIFFLSAFVLALRENTGIAYSRVIAYTAFGAVLYNVLLFSLIQFF